MLKRKIKDGTTSNRGIEPTQNIDDNQNIIDNLTKALDQEKEENFSPITDKKNDIPKGKISKSKKKQAKVNTKFGQVKVRHARRGISSCLLAVMGIFILSGLIASAYQSYGDAPKAVGGLSILTTIFCSIGFMNAIHGFRERDKNYITCKVGILFNGIIIFLFFLLYMKGL